MAAHLTPCFTAASYRNWAKMLYRYLQISFEVNLISALKVNLISALKVNLISALK
jgi:hypothetical protein